MLNMKASDLARLTPEDRDELERFAEFLRATGGKDPKRLKEWVEVDPGARLEYLGIAPEQMEEPD